MHAFKYVGDGEREIPAAGVTVKPGDTFEVPDDIAAGFAGQDMFEPVKTKTKSAPAAEKEEK